MNIFKRWHNRNQRKLFKRGFGWAIAAYYIENMSIVQLQGYCDEADVFGTANSFDKGIKQAIQFIKKNNSYKELATKDILPINKNCVQSLYPDWG